MKVTAVSAQRSGTHVDSVAADALGTTSLSTPVGDSGRDLADTLGAEDRGFELAELHLVLGPAMATRNEREPQIRSLRCHGNRGQAEIGEQIGISQVHVSRLPRRALDKLRIRLADDTPAAVSAVRAAALADEVR